MDISDIVAEQTAFKTAMAQQEFNIGVQKQVLDFEPSMINKIMESGAAATKFSQDAMGQRGIGQLHHMPNASESLRADFAQFRRRVLEKAYKDINSDKTGLFFEWEPVKRGKAVVAIRFMFSPGRRAIAKVATDDAKVEETRVSTNWPFLEASRCAQAKSGACAKRDNKKDICRVCMELGICDGLRKARAQP